MEPKETIRPRVIIEYALDNKTHYCAAFVEGYGGSDIVLQTPMGRHTFSRADGTWLSGDCMNYVDAAIRDFDKVEASISAGYSGDVEMHAKSIPTCAPAAS
jgi:hypothetical protein